MGLRTTRPNEVWHIDPTVIRLRDGSRAYLHAVIDNFSRRILAWHVAGAFAAGNSVTELLAASEGAAASARHAQVVVPPTRTARVSRHGPRSSVRDRAITDALGRRQQWQKASGYHRQARVENAFFRYKSIIVDGLRARSRHGRDVEASLACRVLNRMTALGRPESIAISQ
ncbi:DDE-type integrase/transposase/recombinase [Luteitalea pratensis]|uniref:DDE-type integrase/transposase/recombinase n=1 Tax=Luteitalea pratensis TaxID=1855912 RepID=UPI0012FFB098|nr:DDE-type integrase/transposase/recombinase [Luteitalea pratensis]